MIWKHIILEKSWKRYCKSVKEEQSKSGSMNMLLKIKVYLQEWKKMSGAIAQIGCKDFKRFPLQRNL